MPAMVLACPSCGFENPKAWRACAKCGVSLAVAAGRTGAHGFRDATIVSASPDFGEDMATVVDPEGPSDDADGEIGSFTELRVSRGSTLGFTDDTGTVAARRGRGLARAVKVESLRRLRADHPEVDVVSTSNAEENVAMRRLNESIGFRATVVVTGAVVRLAPG